MIATPADAAPSNALLRKGEVAPGITFEALRLRRRALAEIMPNGSVAVLSSSQPVYMAGVIPYPYRQDADFRYLTGIVQPGIAIFHKPSSAPELRYTLLLPSRSPERAVWDGRTLSLEAAVDPFGADAAAALTEDSLARVLASKLRHASFLLVDLDQLSPMLARCLPDALKVAGVGSASVPQRRAPGGPHPTSPAADVPIKPLRPLLHSMRWIKSPAERAAMHAAVGLGTSALMACMAAAHAGMTEGQLAALFEFRCASGGASRLAYPSVVASGADATTIHYGRNDKRIEPGTLLLMDAGCELWGYSSDVTRTWPVSGRFTPPQRAVYDAVLTVHKECLARCKPGAVLRDIHEASANMLADALHDLGVRSPAGGRLAPGGYRAFYPHSVGHWLGLDTHDASLVMQDTPLREGCVLTIEPGLYFRGSPGVPEELVDIGVRIEDDVLVTADGARVLSGAAPIEVSEVEALAGSRAAEWRALCTL